MRHRQPTALALLDRQRNRFQESSFPPGITPPIVGGLGGLVGLLGDLGFSSAGINIGQIPVLPPNVAQTVSATVQKLPPTPVPINPPNAPQSGSEGPGGPSPQQGIIQRLIQWVETLHLQDAILARVFEWILTHAQQLIFNDFATDQRLVQSIIASLRPKPPTPPSDPPTGFHPQGIPVPANLHPCSSCMKAGTLDESEFEFEGG